MGFFRKKIKGNPKDEEMRFHNIWSLFQDDARKLPLTKNEQLIGTIPAYIGVRDQFDPTHSYSCGSCRDKIEEWKLGAFITTSKYFMFRKMNPDKTFTTAIKVPFTKVYETDVSGIDDKQLELLTSIGSYEFKFIESESAYKFQNIVEKLMAITQKSDNEGNEIEIVSCPYCKIRNTTDHPKCTECGAPLF